VLVGLLGEASVEVAWQAEELLHYAAGDTAPTAVIGRNTEAERLACRAAWQGWWRQNGGTRGLSGVGHGMRRPGLVLAYEASGREGSEGRSGRTWVFGCDGVPRYCLLDRRGFDGIRWRPSGGTVAVGGGPEVVVVARGLTGRVEWE